MMETRNTISISHETLTYVYRFLEEEYLRAERELDAFKNGRRPNYHTESHYHQDLSEKYRRFLEFSKTAGIDVTASQSNLATTNTASE